MTDAIGYECTVNYSCGEKDGGVSSCTGKRSRLSLKLAQKRVAELIDVDEYAIINIKKGTENLNLDVRNSPIWKLNIGSWYFLDRKCQEYLLHITGCGPWITTA